MVAALRGAGAGGGKVLYGTFNKSLTFNLIIDFLGLMWVGGLG